MHYLCVSGYLIIYMYVGILVCVNIYLCAVSVCIISACVHDLMGVLVCTCVFFNCVWVDLSVHAYV